MEDLLEQTRSHRQMEQSLFFQTPSQSSYKLRLHAPTSDTVAPQREKDFRDGEPIRAECR
ncbi:hypothetical protein BofuT4_P133380.1 [Botrytis cinerea T4]|uniref:Uncharacterized protein n=1 Tax=Botryotinia fuckeliana (strain T4) TaxID=999810 RepID=G2YQ86_BOTF4|nr:hypothetical protein BofuT4_P133380.1 [Botrytis cinerea T4]